MNRNLYLFSALTLFFWSCKEEQKPNVQPMQKVSKSEVKSTKKAVYTKHFTPKAQLKPEVIPPDPRPPYDPIEPWPIDPPGYISEPVINCVGTPDPFPKTIRDSIVNFPATVASYGNNNTDIFKYIDDKIAGSTEWNYLRELGIEGKIYIRLLIDIKGKVREVNFLKFSEKALEILKPRLITALLTMPNWIPAKDQNGNAVVSEFTFPIRVSFK